MTVHANVHQSLSAATLLRKKAAIKQELLAATDLLEKRIAVLGGSTTAEVVDQLELALLMRGIRPIFFQGEYGQYYQEALSPSAELQSFKPDMVYLHITAVNINAYPAVSDTPQQVEALLQQQTAHWRQVWDCIAQQHACTIIQNNFEQPWFRPLGNLDGTDIRGRSRFVSQLNEKLMQAAAQRSGVIIHDLHYLSARVGLDRWFNPRLWYWAKYAMDMEMIPVLANQLAAVMASVWGKSAKALVVDLDNTLWGGVVGDDGVEGIQLGADTATGEAYQDFQRYLKALQQRGVLLAVASKNDESIARAAFAHPDNVLKTGDFVAFQAHWEPKPGSLQVIAREINIGIDSLVFVDDNPVERALVRQQMPDVCVPEMGDDVTDYIRILDQAALFETLALSQDDLQRAAQYQHNAQRESRQGQFASYEDFLKSLQMRAEIAPFSALYMDRITQLINKTNQFNLTTRRYTQAQVEQMAASKNFITLYGRLQDTFGDNGLVAIVTGEIKQNELHLDLWLMSCRVLKRGMEYAMFERLCVAARHRNLTRLVGYYLPTTKNAMVAKLYAELGFALSREDKEGSLWTLDLSVNIDTPKHFIQVSDEKS